MPVARSANRRRQRALEMGPDAEFADARKQRERLTAPTGIAAANIRGSTIYSLLSLVSNSLVGERLLRAQLIIDGVKLLIIDEYSFPSVEIIEKLHDRLHAIFPHSTLPFGGMNIVLCGDPAQLAPVLAMPVYAYQGREAHRAARFHLFRTVVELYQPFRQTRNDGIQSRFRSLLARLSKCEANEDAWRWLQTHVSSLSADENACFDSSKYCSAPVGPVQQLLSMVRVALLSLGRSLPHKVNRSRPQLELHSQPLANGACMGRAPFLWVCPRLLNRERIRAEQQRDHRE